MSCSLPHGCNVQVPAGPAPGRREEPDQVDVRIGIIQTPKELEVELKDDADRDKVVAEIEKLLKSGDGVLWLTCVDSVALNVTFSGVLEEFFFFLCVVVDRILFETCSLLFRFSLFG